MQVDEVRCRSSLSAREEKVEAALARLKSLKWQVSELRAKCEALQKLQAEKLRADLACNECGRRIKQDEEILFKDSSGKVKSRYHRDCFKAIWLSQNWVFDYSSPGFLKMSEGNR